MVARKCRRRRRRRVASRRRRQPERRCYSRERRQPDEGTEWTASRVIDSSVLRGRPGVSGFSDEEGEEGSPSTMRRRLRRRCVRARARGCASGGKKGFSHCGGNVYWSKGPEEWAAWLHAALCSRVRFRSRKRAFVLLAETSQTGVKKLASVNFREWYVHASFSRGYFVSIYMKRGKYRIYFYATSAIQRCRRLINNKNSNTLNLIHPSIFVN